MLLRKLPVTPLLLSSTFSYRKHVGFRRVTENLLIILNVVISCGYNSNIYNKAHKMRCL